MMTIGGGAWSLAESVWELHDTVKENKEAVDRMEEENEREHARIKNEINRLVGAILGAREKDREIITNLRIAVAAMKAAKDAREGRAAYEPEELGIRMNSGGVEEEADDPPRTIRARIQMSREAEEDSEEALNRVERAQEEGDPLAGLRLEL
jgi:hypothetical protein